MNRVVCEVEDCWNPATTEWVWRDSDGGDVYYTFRCDDHPDTDQDYEAYPFPLASDSMRLVRDES